MKPALIDVHCHLLPGLDDGCRDPTESLLLARQFVDAGYTHAACTPHVWPQHTRHRPAFITLQTAALQAMLDEHDIPLTLVPGAELNLTLDIHALHDDDIPTYAMQRRYALFDFWDDVLPEHFFRWIDRLTRLGVRPVVAHPERVGCFQADPDLAHRLLERGLLLQCNLQPLTGELGPAARDLAERLLREDAYHVIGTDAHRIDTMPARLAGLDRARELLDTKTFTRLTHDHPKQLLGLT
jgi:protein-tyrosine phosphatase